MANPTMEKQARIILRSALVMHYIVGIDAGEAVEAWLKKHGGWLPDSQEDYGGCTPADEGEEVMSADPEVAMVEAKSLLQRLVDTVGDVHDPLNVLPGARKWLQDLTLSRKRSRSLVSSLRADVARAAGRDVALMGELREDGDKLSIIDAIAFAYNITKHQAKNIFEDLCVRFPALVDRCPCEKFSGKGQRETPQCDVKTIAEIFMLLCFARGSRASSSNELPADLVIEPVAPLPPPTMDDMLRRMIQEEVAKAVAGEWEVMHGMLKDVMEALEVLKGTQDLGA